MPTKDASQRRPALTVRKEENNNNIEFSERRRNEQTDSDTCHVAVEYTCAQQIPYTYYEWRVPAEDIYFLLWKSDDAC